VWHSVDGSGSEIFARRYDAAGAAIGTEFRVNTYTTAAQNYPRAASTPDGRTVVVWFSAQDGGGAPGEAGEYGIFGQRYASNGTMLGTEFQVNTYTTEAQTFPAVSTDDDGNFVVAWSSYEQDGSSEGVFGQRFGSTGLPLGTEFLINTDTSSRETYVDITSGAGGDFVVGWSANADSSGYGVLAQRFSSTGARVGVECLINSYTTNHQVLPAVTRDAEGDFVVVWESWEEDGDSEGIFGRHRPEPRCPAAVDTNCVSGFDKGQLIVKEDVAGKEKLMAKLQSGPASTQSDLGEPLRGCGTAYSLCLYDDGGTLAGELHVDRAAERTCVNGTKPCWKSLGAAPPLGKGYQFKDGGNAPSSGVRKVTLKTGNTTQATLSAKASPAFPLGIAAALAGTTSVTLQVRASDAPLPGCYSKTLADIKTQTATSFSAR
jgi:hypothetical protein